MSLKWKEKFPNNEEQLASARARDVRVEVVETVRFEQAKRYHVYLYLVRSKGQELPGIVVYDGSDRGEADRIFKELSTPRPTYRGS